MSSMKKYMVREKAQQPVRVYLVDPSTDKKTDDWMEIRSSLSDEFLEARDRAMGAPGEFIPDKEERKKAVRERQLRLKAALVAAWSFDEKCTEENIVEFIREAPQIQEMILRVADDNASFFGRPSTTSTSGQQKK